MSSDPDLLSAENDPPLWAGQYSGPAEADGHHLLRVQLLAYQFADSHPSPLRVAQEVQLTASSAHALADWLVSKGYGVAGRAHAATLGRFVCPRCFKVSNNPDDLKHGFCARCHDWTGGV